MLLLVSCHHRECIEGIGLEVMQKAYKIIDTHSEEEAEVRRMLFLKIRFQLVSWHFPDWMFHPGYSQTETSGRVSILELFHVTTLPKNKAKRITKLLKYYNIKEDKQVGYNKFCLLPKLESDEVIGWLSNEYDVRSMVFNGFCLINMRRRTSPNKSLFNIKRFLNIFQ